MSLEGCGSPPASTESHTLKVTFRCDDCGHEWTEEVTEGTGELLCPIPNCGAKIYVFKQTKISDTSGINHYKCPKGHSCPDECQEHLPDCVVDVPYLEGPPECCVCPSCKGCAPRGLGICQKDGKCWIRTVCGLCGHEYLCPPNEGEICPFCCRSDSLVEVLEVDANGEPVVTGDSYTVHVYCKRCKKGSEGTPPDDIEKC